MKTFISIPLENDIFRLRDTYSLSTKVEATTATLVRVRSRVGNPWPSKQQSVWCERHRFYQAGARQTLLLELEEVEKFPCGVVTTQIVYCQSEHMQRGDPHRRGEY